MGGNRNAAAIGDGNHGTAHNNAIWRRPRRVGRFTLRRQISQGDLAGELNRGSVCLGRRWWPALQRRI
jgi:hypothetical protein